MLSVKAVSCAEFLPTTGKYHGRRHIFVPLPFVAADDGVAAGEPTECFNPFAVVMRAEALARKGGHVGAVAFSRTGDPATGRKFGDVPDDLSALWEGHPMSVIRGNQTPS
jgi:hypothetical protein